MRKYVFFYKENGSNDRDCVKYTNINRLGKLECGHYFPNILLSGACFSVSLKLDEIDFENITTVLSKEEFIQLDNYNSNINDLGYGIKQGDERYLKGIELYNSIKPILEKLLSLENEELFNQIQEEEKEYLKEEYSLEDEEIDYIFNNYNLDYRDRGIVGHIYEDIEEASREEAESLGYINESNRNGRYFDYETFGEDMLEGEQYLQLPSGKIVYCMY